MEILLKPLITEKMTKIGPKQNRYGFYVHPDANKAQIAEAVEKSYNVSVLSVNTIRVAGKHKSRYTKKGVVSGKTVLRKKAIVKLVEGDEIDFFSNI